MYNTIDKTTACTIAGYNIDMKSNTAIKIAYSLA